MIAVVLVCGSLLFPLAKRVGLPHGALLMLFGFVAAQTTSAVGGDIGLRWYHFKDIVFYLLLPILVFECAWRIDIEELRSKLFLVLALAIPGAIVCALAAAMIMFLLVGHETGFPLLLACLVGAILSATDPSAIVGRLKHTAKARRLTFLLEGESLFSDASAIVMFTILMSLLAMQTADVSIAGLSWRFLHTVLGAVLIGFAGGLLLRIACRYLVHSELRTLVAVACAYCAYIACEYSFGFSGVVAVLVLVMLNLDRRGDKINAEFLATIGHAAAIGVYVLAGATITLNLFSDQWLAMLIAIAASVCARFLIVPAIIGLWNSSRKAGDGFALGELAIVAAAGGRGVVAMALALSLPLELNGWFTAQAMVYGVVIFSLFVQTPLLSLLIERRNWPDRKRVDVVA